MNILLALSPILLLLIILIWRPLTLAAPFTLIYTMILGLFLRQNIIPPASKGLLLAMDISLIIFGAIFFLDMIKQTRFLSHLKEYLGEDKRVQAIILIWFAGSFIEGIAGFGTPAAIIAPLLVGLGFAPLLAVSLALIGNSTAVAFGALGTPIRIGLGGGNSEIVFFTALINLIVGIIVPLMILAVLVLSEKKPTWKYFREKVPFALFAGVCFTIPYFLFSFLGVEFPSVFGSLMGLIIIVSLVKKKVKHDLRVYLPYIILIILMVLGKFFLPTYSLNLGSGIIHNLNLFNPGGILIVSGIITYFIFHFKNIKEISHHALKIIPKPVMVIFSLVTLIQIMIVTGMIQTIGELFKGKLLYFLAPFVGGFGAFVSGSATLSNILFGSMLATSGSALILALHTVGAGAGNMIALMNIIAAEAIVKIEGQEKEILKRTIVPCLIYLTLAGILGVVIFLVSKLFV